MKRNQLDPLCNITTMKICSLVLALVYADAFVVQHRVSHKLSTLEAHKIHESWGQLVATAALSAMLLASPLPALADGVFTWVFKLLTN